MLNVTVFGGKGFKEVIRLNEVIKVPPYQQDWCPYMKRRHPLCTCTRKGHVGTWSEGSHLQGKGRAFATNHPS